MNNKVSLVKQPHMHQPYGDVPEWLLEWRRIGTRRVTHLGRLSYLQHNGLVDLADALRPCDSFGSLSDTFAHLPYRA